MIITRDRVLEVLEYDRDAGNFRWKWRSDIARMPSWNQLFAGKDAGRPNTRGYIQISVDGRRYLRSWLVWLCETGALPAELDHKDRDKTNDRWGNLRNCTHAENARNRLRGSNNTSSHKGVSFHKASGKWAAQIRCGVPMWLGLFESPEAASAAYQAAATRLHGEFAPGARTQAP